MNTRSVVTSWQSASRRLIALAMACSLLFGLLPVAQAMPSQRFKAEIPNAAGIGGQSVAVSVYLEPGLVADQDDAFWAYSLNLTYDPNVLTLSAPVADEAAAQQFEADTSAAGIVDITASSFGDLGFVDERRKVATLSFTINKDAVPGTTVVGLASASYIIDQQPVAIDSLLSGTVTVLNDAPTAGGVAVVGMPTVGQTLTGGYAYADREGNAEGASGYRWYAASDAAGTDRAPIADATARSLVPTDALLGKYLFFEVMPIAAGGATAGAAALSAAAGPVEAVRETAAVSIGQASGLRGANVEVHVTLADASAGIGSYGLRLAFDPSALEVTGISGPGAELFDSGYDNEAGWLKASWADIAGGDGALGKGAGLFTVTFKIKADAAYGPKPLTVADEADLRQFTVTDAAAYETVKTLTAGSVHVNEPAPVQSDKEIITIDVKDAGTANGGSVAKAQIERTKKSDGTKSDRVVLTAAQAKQTVESILAAHSTMASIVIPDAKDEVSEVSVTVPKDAGQAIRDAKIGLGIVTDNVQVRIPSASLQGFEDELYFRFLPVKSEAGKREVKTRAEQDKLVLAAAGKLGVQVVGRPMTIETNLQNREVTLVMPLKDTGLSREELAGLAVYVEHSDGTRELLYGKLVPYNEAGSELGIAFQISKFSTFTLVRTAGDTHEAYMKGYADGTFRPDRTVTRAEIAAILSRTVKLPASAANIAYKDVADGYWAQDAISSVTAMGLMKGYADGTFDGERRITRAELATLAAKLIDAGSADGKDPAGTVSGTGFTDVAGTWAEAAIVKARSAGVIVGYADGSFRPDRPVTRAEAVTIMNKLLGRDASYAQAAGMTWHDVPDTHWAYADILEASVTHRYTQSAEGREQPNFTN